MFRILALIVCVALTSLFWRCSPQKRLNRLIANNPELAKTDTVYTTKEITIPGFHLDTTFTASDNVNGLSEIIEHYRQYIDSVNRQKLTSEIKNYIINRPCLEDTFKISLANNGYCKIWQKAGLFYYQLNQPARRYNFTVPVSLTKFEVTTKNNWIMFWIGAACGLVLVIMIFLFGKWLKIAV